MPTKQRGTTAKNRLHRPTYMARQSMIMRIRVIPLLQNLLYGDVV